jgi:hypothetical protein
VFLNELKPGADEKCFGTGPHLLRRKTAASPRVPLHRSRAAGWQVAQDLVEHQAGQTPAAGVRGQEKTGDGPRARIGLHPVLANQLLQAVAPPDLCPAGRLVLQVEQVAVVLAAIEEGLSQRPIRPRRALSPAGPSRNPPGNAPTQTASVFVRVHAKEVRAEGGLQAFDNDAHWE